MVGTRGIPASYSGFETFVEELGARLVARGHRVTVYCRSHHIRHPAACYRGMRLVKLPTIRNKYADTIVHTVLSCLHLLPRRDDVVLMCIAGNSPAALIPRLAGKRVVLNVDGLDWQRDKWPPLAKRYLRCAEWLATKLPHAVVTDSRAVEQYYLARFGRRTHYIPYGTAERLLPPDGALARLGLEPGRYVLYVGRLEPENRIHHLVEAFAQLDTDLKCVIVGDAPYAGAYIAELKRRAGPNVLFPGYLFGDGYWELNSNACAYAFTSAASGTHPALLEAMACGNCVIVNDTPTNREAAGDAVLRYNDRDGAAALARQLRVVLADPALRADYGARARRHIAAHYSWERVTDSYEALFRGLLGPGRGGR
jgi:glycosyltransferase involved in cell wall biosynthesis